jgi:uncharacterized oxidoreductase
MNTTGNTILITGGGSGIGEGLAAAFHALGNQIIIAGRRKGVLEKTAAKHPGMKWLTLDITDPASIHGFAEKLAHDFPKTNVLINNSGIMKTENLTVAKIDLADSEATITTNLLGPIRLTAALLPLLRKQANSTVMMVTSGLAFVPLAATPTYCATKAAIHSYTQSLRLQLQGSTTEVLELVPPYVQTELTGEHQKTDPRAMPLADYIAEAMKIIQSQPKSAEICVERVNGLRHAAANGKYAEIYKGLNEMRPPPK